MRLRELAASLWTLYNIGMEHMDMNANGPEPGPQLLDMSAAPKGEGTTPVQQFLVHSQAARRNRFSGGAW
jgi:hypothetical protein